MTTLIGLTGYKRTGKSTAAKYLEDKHGFVRHNFKDALVEELKERFPDLIELLEIHYNLSTPQLFIQKPPLVRALMVNYGTEVRRKDNPDYWVEEWSSKVYIGDKVVTDDVRFLNEADAIERRHGIIIRLVRPDITSGGTHKSETEQNEFKADYTIQCEPGNHQKLYDELDAILRDIL